MSHWSVKIVWLVSECFCEDRMMWDKRCWQQKSNKKEWLLLCFRKITNMAELPLQQWHMQKGGKSTAFRGSLKKKKITLQRFTSALLYVYVITLRYRVNLILISAFQVLEYLKDLSLCCGFLSFASVSMTLITLKTDPCTNICQLVLLCTGKIIFLRSFILQGGERLGIPLSVRWRLTKEEAVHVWLQLGKLYDNNSIT